MIISPLTIQTLDSLLVTINTIYLCHSKNLVSTYNPKFSSKLSKLCANHYSGILYHKKTSQVYIILTINIIQNIIHLIYKTTIQNISLIILQQINSFPNPNHVAQNYLERYKNTFRRLFIRNFIGFYFYDNDLYINKIAMLNLYILLLCSKRKSAYILWIYITFYKIPKSIFG